MNQEKEYFILKVLFSCETQEQFYAWFEWVSKLDLMTETIKMNYEFVAGSKCWKNE